MQLSDVQGMREISPIDISPKKKKKKKKTSIVRDLEKEKSNYSGRKKLLLKNNVVLYMRGSLSNKRFNIYVICFCSSSSSTTRCINLGISAASEVFRN